MTTSLLQPQKLPPANDGHVRDSLTADERLLRKAVQRVLRAQVAEVHGKVEGGAKANAVPEKITKWDQEVMKEVRPIWFGLFKKGGDKALRNIRRFPKHARKMAVLSWAEMQASERVGVVEKGGPGSGNFGHEGRPGEVGGSGPGGGYRDGGVGLEKTRAFVEKHPYLYHITSRENARSIIAHGLVPSKEGYSGPGVYLAVTPEQTEYYLKPNDPNSAMFRVSSDYVMRTWGMGPDGGVDFDSTTGEVVVPGTIPPEEIHFIRRGEKSLKATPSIVIPEWIEDPDVLDALEKEMFKFAHGINQTTADDLRAELIDGMENGETISQLADRIAGLSDEWVEGWRSEMIARTETARAFSTGHIEAWRSTGVVDRKVWVAAGDACPFCQQMDGTVVDLDENFFDQGDEQTTDWRGQEVVMGHGYSDVNGPPLHPNCITDGAVPIFTSKGWKPIRNIKEQELVLTHKGRFRKVVKAICSAYGAGTTKITFGKAGRKLTLTDNHPVLIGGRWVAAKDVKQGDTLSILGHPCARCGKITMWNMKYCSHTCLSLDITDKQWANPKHRVLVARKNSISMNRQYRSGKRDRFEITKGMNNAVRKLSAQGKWNHMNPVGLNRWAKSAEGRAYSHKHMTENNPVTIPEVHARMIASCKETMRLHPERHPNVVMAQRGFISSIEKKVKELLDAIGIAYTQQHPVDRFFVDFAIPSLMVAIEVDGNYWHKDNQRDLDRQRIIEDKGWHVVRFREDQINEDLQSVSQELVRIAANHAGEYKFADVKVLKVERKNLKRGRAVYNLSVAEDESYIAKGMVVHNCRCVLVAELDEEKMVKKNVNATNDGD